VTVKLEDGYVMIDVADLFQRLSVEQKTELAQHLACDEAVLGFVADQLLDGWTEAGWHGYKHTGDAEPTTALDKARRRIALGASETANKVIDELQRSIKNTDEDVERYRKWAFAMYHAWPTHHVRERPELPDPIQTARIVDRGQPSLHPEGGS